MIDWINSFGGPKTTAESMQDGTVYLMPEFTMLDEIDALVAELYPEIFELELESWYTDESRWPTPRTLAMFHEWFSFEVRSCIQDLCAAPLLDDGI